MQCYTVRSMVGWCSSECGVRNQRSRGPAVAMVEDDTMYAVMEVKRTKERGRGVTGAEQTMMSHVAVVVVKRGRRRVESRRVKQRRRRRGQAAREASTVLVYYCIQQSYKGRLRPRHGRAIIAIASGGNDRWRSTSSNAPVAWWPAFCTALTSELAVVPVA
jgi:hypothetical protein